MHYFIDGRLHGALVCVLQRAILLPAEDPRGLLIITRAAWHMLVTRMEHWEHFFAKGALFSSHMCALRSAPPQSRVWGGHATGIQSTVLKADQSCLQT